MKLDTSKKPMIPNGWTIESHDKSMGKIDPTKISLWLHEKQKTGYIEGNELRKELPKEVLNATVLDYLLKNPKLIPEDWKGKYVFFWGTIYCDSDGHLYVRYLYWHDDAWDWSFHWLGHDWHGLYPSAVLASVSGTKSSESLPLSFDPLKLEIIYNGVKYKLIKQ